MYFNYEPLVLPVERSWASFHKAILATIDLSYLQLILRLPALIFTSVPRNNFKTIVYPALANVMTSATIKILYGCKGNKSLVRNNSDLPS